MEHHHDQSVPEERMDPTYRQQEEAFRDAAGQLWAEEEALRSRLRADPSLSAEERQDAYRVRHADLQRRYEGLLEKFSTGVSRGVSEAMEILSSGTGEKFAEHLTRVSGLPDERLAEVMSTARRSSQEDLQRAVALTSYERGLRPLWMEWSEANPQRAEAIKVLRSTPGAAQLHTRTNALRPPRADEADIESQVADVQAAERTAAESEAARGAFFAARASAPRRQVGRRIA